MYGNRLRGLIEHLRRVTRPHESGGLADAELLRRWVAGRDEAAFEVLLWRHGGMVLGVCRRILRDAHEAEDALQATFLVLARKAGSVARREALAGWLYRVAYRVALAARARAARCGAQDAAALESATAEPADDVVWRDLRPVLDEEIGRLPAKYRLPFVLRYLEGRSNEEVARELGCPLGTAVSRLARARERLRLQLTRRGLALSAAALAAALSESATAATVPSGLVVATVKAAALAAVGQSLAGVVSLHTITLSEGVLHGMALMKLKVTAALALAVLAAGVGTGLAYRLTAAEQTGPAERVAVNQEAPAPPAKADDPQKRADDAKIRALLKERRDVLRQALEFQKRIFKVGRMTLADFLPTHHKLLEAELELATTPAERVAAYQAYFDQAQAAEKWAAAAVKGGQLTDSDYNLVKAERLKAEIGLLRAKRQAR